MKRFTKRIIESVSCITSDINPGNALEKTGVMNHYTPIQNILTNVRNLFCSRLSLICAIGEDGVSLKLHSSKFTSEKAIYDIIYYPMFNDYDKNSSTLAGYISSQGLSCMKIIPVGKYYIVYFFADDLSEISKAEDIDYHKCCACPCEEQVSMDILELEMKTLINEDELEEEIKDVTLEKIMNLIDSKDKVKAAKQLELLVTQQIELPREFYFAGIKFKDGEESIALRWKYTKKLPNGKTTEITRSILHIFGKGDKAIWVQDFAKDSLVQLPDEIKKLIENVLDILEADKTDDPSIFKLTGERKEREDSKKDKDDKEDDNKEDKEKNNNKKESDLDNDDSEDDDSRGENDDLLK